MLVGRVVRPHGVRGEVKVEVLSDVPGRFAAGVEFFLVVHRRPPQIVRIESCRLVRGGALVLFEGIGDRDEAESLRDARLEVDLSEVPPAPEGFYYHFELVGCRCHEAEAGDLGEVSAVIEDGGGHLLEVDDGGRRLLVPFVDAFLENVDIVGRRIDLRLPPGLIEVCTSKS